VGEMERSKGRGLCADGGTDSGWERQRERGSEGRERERRVNRAMDSRRDRGRGGMNEGPTETRRGSEGECERGGRERGIDGRDGGSGREA